MQKKMFVQQEYCPTNEREGQGVGKEKVAIDLIPRRPNAKAKL